MPNKAPYRHQPDREPTPPLHPFTTTILKWFAENGRDLPWRATRDPYPIWLSEIILQQTRIAQGQAYWERFMERYPTVEDLASASEDDVLRLWQGLGYYSRARHLHAAARQIVALGHFPDTYEEIRQLKGVGDYTAAAIGSIAFHLPVAVVDGNVYRVLSRYFGIDTPIDTTQGKKEFAALAQSLLPEKEASAYNQGMMDFGAMQCSPASPQCTVCPLADSCQAFLTGSVDSLPCKQKSTTVKTQYLTYIYLRCQGYTAIRRRGKGDIWQGLWEPLNITPADRHRMTVDEVQSILNGDGSLTLVAAQVKHVLTHRILLADFYLMDTRQRPTLPEGYLWVREDEMDQYGIPRLIEILIGKIK